MKVKIPGKKIFVMWLIVFALTSLAVFGIFFNLFIFQKWTFIQPTIIGVYCLLMVGILILSLNGQYYEINKKDVTEVKFGKKFVYFYSDVVYIDLEESERSKTLSFVTKYGHVKYLTFDKDGQIFLAFKNKCHNLISREELMIKYPGIKI